MGVLRHSTPKPGPEGEEAKRRLCPSVWGGKRGPQGAESDGVQGAADSEVNETGTLAAGGGQHPSKQINKYKL